MEELGDEITEMIKVELSKEDLEFICIGLCCYMRRSLKNLKEESQEQVRVTLRKMEEAREEVRSVDEITIKLELTSEETAYVTYCIGFAYAHMSEHQQGIVKRVLNKITKAKEVKSRAKEVKSR